MPWPPPRCGGGNSAPFRVAQAFLEPLKRFVDLADVGAAIGAVSLCFGCLGLAAERSSNCL